MGFPRNMRQARRYFETVDRMAGKEPEIDALIEATSGGGNLPGVPGPQGEPGPPGKSVHLGLGPPALDLGRDDDSYVDIATGDVFLKE